MALPNETATVIIYRRNTSKGLVQVEQRVEATFGNDVERMTYELGAQVEKALKALREEFEPDAENPALVSAAPGQVEADA